MLVLCACMCNFTVQELQIKESEAGRDCHRKHANTCAGNTMSRDATMVEKMWKVLELLLSPQLAL